MHNHLRSSNFLCTNFILEENRHEKTKATVTRPDAESDAKTQEEARARLEKAIKNDNCYMVIADCGKGVEVGGKITDQFMYHAITALKEGAKEIAEKDDLPRAFIDRLLEILAKQIEDESDGCKCPVCEQTSTTKPKGN